MFNTYTFLVGKLERKRSLGKPVCRWIIKNNIMEVTCEGMD
jgi:hypothetical protein